MTALELARAVIAWREWMALTPRERMALPESAIPIAPEEDYPELALARALLSLHAECERMRETAAERLAFMLHIYGGYTIGARGPAGCIMDALDALDPDTAALIRDVGADEAYVRRFDAETGMRREAPRVFVRLDPHPDAVGYETCSNCQKHIRHHYGAPSEATKQWPAYRCDPKPEAALDASAKEK